MSGMAYLQIHFELALRARVDGLLAFSIQLSALGKKCRLMADALTAENAETRQQVALPKVERSTPAADRQGLTRRETVVSGK
jgi:hypothetical protein